MLLSLVNNRQAILNMTEVVDNMDGLKGEMFGQMHSAIPKRKEDLKLYKIKKPEMTEYFVQIWKVFRLVWNHPFFECGGKDGTVVAELGSYYDMMTTFFDNCSIALQAELELNKNGESMKMPAADAKRGYLQDGATIPAKEFQTCPCCKEGYMHEPPENKEIRARNAEETRKWNKDIVTLESYKNQAAERGNKRKKGAAIPIPLDRFGDEMTKRVPALQLEPEILVCKVYTLVDHSPWGWRCPSKCGLRTCTLCKNTCRFVCSKKNYTEKEQYFRNQGETTETQRDRQENAANTWLDSARDSSKLFRNVLLTEVVERRNEGKIAVSTSDAYLEQWASNAAHDKTAHSMINSRVEYDALTHIQDSIRAVQDPRGAAYTKKGDLRKTSRSKKRAENTGLVGAENFHGIYIDAHQPHLQAANESESHSSISNYGVSDGNTVRSSPSLPMSEAIIKVQESVALKEIRTEVVYESGMATDDGHGEILDEVVALLMGPEYDEQLVSVNEIMAERGHSVKERLSSLVRIVERRKKSRSNTI